MLVISQVSVGQVKQRSQLKVQGYRLTVSLHMTNDQSFLVDLKKKKVHFTLVCLRLGVWKSPRVKVVSSWMQVYFSAASRRWERISNTNYTAFVLLQWGQCKCTPPCLPQVFQRMQQGQNRLAGWRRVFCLCHSSHFALFEPDIRNWWIKDTDPRNRWVIISNPSWSLS